MHMWNRTTVFPAKSFGNRFAWRLTCYTVDLVTLPMPRVCKHIANVPLRKHDISNAVSYGHKPSLLSAVHACRRPTKEDKETGIVQHSIFGLVGA